MSTIKLGEKPLHVCRQELWFTKQSTRPASQDDFYDESLSYVHAVPRTLIQDYVLYQSSALLDPISTLAKRISLRPCLLSTLGAALRQKSSKTMSRIISIIEIWNCKTYKFGFHTVLTVWKSGRRSANLASKESLVEETATRICVHSASTPWTKVWD